MRVRSSDSNRSSVRLASNRPLRGALVRALFGLTLLGGLFATPAAMAQNAKLRLERFDFSKLPDLRVYLTFVEEDGTVIAGRQGSDFKLLLDAADQGASSASTTFEANKEPIYAMAVVQASGVVSERALTEVKNGLRRVAEVVGATNGRMGVLSYAGATQRLIESGTSTEVDSAINKITPSAARCGPLNNTNGAPVYSGVKYSPMRFSFGRWICPLKRRAWDGVTFFFAAPSEVTQDCGKGIIMLQVRATIYTPHFSALSALLLTTAQNAAESRLSA